MFVLSFLGVWLATSSMPPASLPFLQPGSLHLARGPAVLSVASARYAIIIL